MYKCPLFSDQCANAAEPRTEALCLFFVSAPLKQLQQQYKHCFLPSCTYSKGKLRNSYSQFTYIVLQLCIWCMYQQLYVVVDRLQYIYFVLQHNTYYTYYVVLVLDRRVLCCTWWRLCTLNKKGCFHSKTRQNAFDKKKYC